MAEEKKNVFDYIKGLFTKNNNTQTVSVGGRDVKVNNAPAQPAKSASATTATQPKVTVGGRDISATNKPVVSNPAKPTTSAPKTQSPSTNSFLISTQTGRENANYYNQMKQDRIQSEQKADKQETQTLLQDRKSVVDTKIADNPDYAFDLYQFRDNNGQAISGQDYKNRVDQYNNGIMNLNSSFKNLEDAYKADGDSAKYLEGYNELTTQANNLENERKALDALTVEYNSTILDEYERNKERMHEITVMTSRKGHVGFVQAQLDALNQEYRNLEARNEAIKGLVDDVKAIQDNDQYQSLLSEGNEKAITQFESYIASQNDELWERASKAPLKWSANMLSGVTAVGDIALDLLGETAGNAIYSVANTLKETGTISDEDFRKISSVAQQLRDFEYNNENNFSAQLREIGRQFDMEMYSDPNMDKTTESVARMIDGAIENGIRYRMLGENLSTLPMVLSTLGDTYSEARANGFSTPVALGTSILKAYITYRSEQLQTEKYFNMLGNVAGSKIDKAFFSLLVNNAISSGLEEFAEEGAEYIADWAVDVVANAIEPNKATPEFNTGDLLNGCFIAMGSAMIGGTEATLRGAYNMARSVPEINSVKEYKMFDAELQNLKAIRDVEASIDVKNTMNAYIELCERRKAQFEAKSATLNAIDFESDNVNLPSQEQAEQTYKEAMVPEARKMANEQMKADSEVTKAYDAIKNITAQTLAQKGIMMDTDEYLNLSDKARSNCTAVKEYADKLKANVVFRTDIDGDGRYNPQTGMIEINPNGELSELSTLVHELTHGTESSGEHYNVLAKLVKEFFGGTDADYKNALNVIKNRYASGKDPIILDDPQAEREFTAINLQDQDLLGNPEFVEKLIRYNDSFAYRIYQNVKNMFSEDIKTHIENAFMQAYRNMQNSEGMAMASKGLTSDQVREDDITGDYGYHYGAENLDPNFKSERLSIRGGRGTGAFGTGTYFFGNGRFQSSYMTDGSKTEHKVDFSDYNLFKPKDSKDGERVHKALKSFDDAYRYVDTNSLNEYLEGLEEVRNDMLTFVGEEEDDPNRPQIKADDLDPDAPDFWAQYDKRVKEFERAYDEYEANRVVPDYDKLNPEDDEYNYFVNRLVQAGMDESEVQGLFAQNADENGDVDLRSVAGELVHYYLDYKDLDVDSDVPESIKGRIKLQNAQNEIEELAKSVGVKPYELSYIVKNAMLDSLAESTRPDFDEAMYDSVGTKVMKALGYEGIDVRNMEGLDNSTYGSVIYDLKPETIQYSKSLTPSDLKSLEKDYNKAVEENDMETAQEIVRDYAVSQGYSPEQFYHATASDGFNEFDKSKIKADETDADYNGFWVTTNPDTSPSFRNPKKTYSLYIKYGNIAPANVIKDVQKELRKDWYNPEQKLHDEARSFQDEVRLRLEDMGYNSIVFDDKVDINTKELEETGATEWTSARGTKYRLEYDEERSQEIGEKAYLLYRWSENQGAWMWTQEDYWGTPQEIADEINTYRHGEKVVVLFEPNQLKSSAPVEYDDNGNVIPLSERFNPETNDIRYSKSLKPEDLKDGIINKEYSDEFKELQRESENIPDSERWEHRSSKIDDSLRRRLSDVFRKELESRNYSDGNGDGLLKDTGEFKMLKDVDGQTFHDIFSIVKNHLPFGELVDLHPVESDEYTTGYNDTTNYLSSDGLSGFSITKDGDLISVFNASPKKGFLRSVAPFIKENAKTLDCFVLGEGFAKTNLQQLYNDAFGFKTASILDFNYDVIAGDHGKEYADNFVRAYGEAPVAFMVKTDADVETKHFTKDQYDEALAYRDSFINKDSDDLNIAEPNISDADDLNASEKELNKYGTISNYTDREHYTKGVDSKTGVVKPSFIVTLDTTLDKTTHQEEIEDAERFAGTVAERLDKGQDVQKAIRRLKDNPLKNGVLRAYYTAQVLYDHGEMDEFYKLAQWARDVENYGGKLIESTKVLYDLDDEFSRAVYVSKVQQNLIDEHTVNNPKNKDQIEDTINELFQKYSDDIINAKTTRAFRTGLGRLTRACNDVLPKSIWSRLKQFRMLSMLSGVKTPIANMESNLATTGLYRMMSKQQALLESALKKATFKTIDGSKTYEIKTEDRKSTLWLDKNKTKVNQKLAEQEWANLKEDLKSKYDTGVEKIPEKLKEQLHLNNKKGIAKAVDTAFDFAENVQSTILSDTPFAHKAFVTKFNELAQARNMDLSTIDKKSKTYNRLVDDAWAYAEEVVSHDETAISKTIANITRNSASNVRINNDTILGGMDQAIKTIKEKANQGQPLYKFIDSAMKKTQQWFVPFYKTNASLLKKTVQFSPLEWFQVGNDYKKVKAGKMDLVDMVEHMAKALTGTELYIMGAIFARLGWLKWDKDDEDYSGRLAIKVPGTDYGYTIDFLDPVSTTLAKGVAFDQELQENGVSFEAGANLVRDYKDIFLSDQLDMFSSMKDFFDTIAKVDAGEDEYGEYTLSDGATDMAFTILNSYIPAIVRDISRMVDPAKKVVYDTSNKRYLLNRLINSTPFRSSLVDKKDATGNTLTYTQPFTDNDFFNRLLTTMSKGKLVDMQGNSVSGVRENPGNLNREDSNAFSQMAKDFQFVDENGDGFSDAHWIRDTVPSNIYPGDNQVELNPEEKDTYGKTWTDVWTSGANYLLNSDEYKNLDYENQADIIYELQGFAREVIEADYCQANELEMTERQAKSSAIRDLCTKDGKLDGEMLGLIALGNAKANKLPNGGQRYVMSVQDEEGNTIKNSRQLYMRHLYEEKGVYEEVLKAIEDSEGLLEYADFGLGKTVVGYSEEKALSLFQQIYNSVFSKEDEDATVSKGKRKKKSSSTGKKEKKKKVSPGSVIRNSGTKTASSGRGISTSKRALLGSGSVGETVKPNSNFLKAYSGSMQKQSNGYRPARGATGGTMTCPKCGNRVSSGMSRCPICGTRLN